MRRLLAVGADDVLLDFPSFSEGLSLRRRNQKALREGELFPFLFGGTFIEATATKEEATVEATFPSFSEGLSLRRNAAEWRDAWVARFPSFSEGLSLRPPAKTVA